MPNFYITMNREILVEGALDAMDALQHVEDNFDEYATDSERESWTLAVKSEAARNA